MGIPGPQNARGAILYDIRQGRRQAPARSRSSTSATGTPSSTPLAEAADNLAARRQPDVLDRRRGVPQDVVRHLRAPRPRAAGRKPSVIEVAGGDSFGGATPPISNFFGDKPTPPIMNMMGIDIDALGNHNFDRGADVPAQRADPAARTSRSSRRTSSSRTARRRRNGRSRRSFNVRPRRQGRLRRLHARGHPERRVPGQPRSVPGRGRSCRPSTPRRRSSSRRPTRSWRSATRARPRGRSTDPTGPLDRPRRRRRRTSTSSSATTTTSRSTRSARTASS